MPKIAASIVFPVCGHPLRNAVVELDNSGFVLSVSSGGASFSELAGVEFYSGILIPGLVDVLSGPGDNLHSLIASGVRVAGRIGNSGKRRGSAGKGDAGPGNSVSGVAGSGKSGSGKEGAGVAGSGKSGSGKPGLGDSGSASAGTGDAGSGTGFNEEDPADPVGKGEIPGKRATEDFDRETWNGRSLGYRTYKDVHHFDKLFRESGIEGVFLFDGPDGESKVLAGMGGDGLWGTIQRLHQGNNGFNLQEILEMATINGAFATGYNHEAGCISEGLNPGLNIIEGIDPSGMKLLPVSRLRRLM